MTTHALPGVSVYPDLQALKDFPDEAIRHAILEALGSQPSGRCLKASLVGKICRLFGVTTLRGRPRQDFTKRVNRAFSLLALHGKVRSVGAGGSSLRLTCQS